VVVPTTAVVLYPTTAVELGLTSVPMIEEAELPVALGLVSLWVELDGLDPLLDGLDPLLDGLDPLLDGLDTLDAEAPVALGLV
jgi:hypothetical protein